MSSHKIMIGEGVVDGRIVMDKGLNQRELNYEFNHNPGGVYGLFCHRLNYALPQKTSFKYSSEGYNDHLDHSAAR